MSKIKQALPEDYEAREGINQIVIWEPRWHDRVVLIADYRIQPDNEVLIMHKDFNHAYALTRQTADKYPLEPMATKRGGVVDMRVIPIDDLTKEVIDV